METEQQQQHGRLAVQHKGWEGDSGIERCNADCGGPSAEEENDENAVFTAYSNSAFSERNKESNFVKSLKTVVSNPLLQLELAKVITFQMTSTFARQSWIFSSMS